MTFTKRDLEQVFIGKLVSLNYGQTQTKGLGLWTAKEQDPPWKGRAKKPTTKKGAKSIVDCNHQHCGNGYIWHATGSGKTLTSLKAATQVKENGYIHKCVFVVGCEDLDRQLRKQIQFPTLVA